MTDRDKLSAALARFAKRHGIDGAVLIAVDEASGDVALFTHSFCIHAAHDIMADILAEEIDDSPEPGDEHKESVN